MDNAINKCVMVLDEALPLGLLANTAGILGFTMGKLLPEMVGPTVTDRSNKDHLGVIEVPIPILKANKEQVKSIREQLYQPEFAEVVVVDFSDIAQSCKNYDEYISKMAGVDENELNYMGLGLFGPKKAVNKLTGSMPLLR